MKFIEEVRDILDIEKKYFICHASSRDLDMSQGLANVINNTYDLVNGIKLKYGTDYLAVGESYVVGNVITLIVKRNKYDSVLLSDIKECIEDLACMVDDEGIRYIAFPKICCGNMGMNWKDVKQIIREVFEDLDVTILICHDNENDIVPDINDVISLLKENHDNMPLNIQGSLYQTIKQVIEDNKYIKIPTDCMCDGKCSSY